MTPPALPSCTKVGWRSARTPASCPNWWIWCSAPRSGRTGVGHTRWAPTARRQSATHTRTLVRPGGCSCPQRHRRELPRTEGRAHGEGVQFRSETDTESVVHLVEHYQSAGSDFVDAARRTFRHIEGANVVVLLSADEPDKIITARIGNAGGW